MTDAENRASEEITALKEKLAAAEARANQPGDVVYRKDGEPRMMRDGKTYLILTECGGMLERWYSHKPVQPYRRVL